MNSKDLKDFIDYIMKNNSWKAFSHLLRDRKQYKYIDLRLDTRDGKIFYISFEDYSENKQEFRIENKKDLKKLYKWLDNKQVSIVERVDE